MTLTPFRLIEGYEANNELDFNLNQAGITLRSSLGFLNASGKIHDHEEQFFIKLAEGFQQHLAPNLSPETHFKKPFEPYMQMMLQYFLQDFQRIYKREPNNMDAVIKGLQSPQSMHHFLEKNLGNPLDLGLHHWFKDHHAHTYYKICYESAFMGAKRSRKAIDKLVQIRTKLGLKLEDCQDLSRQYYFQYVENPPDPFSQQEQRAIFGLGIQLMFAEQDAHINEKVIFNKMLKAFGIKNLEDLKKDIKEIYNVSPKNHVENISQESHRHVLTFLLELCSADETFAEEEVQFLQAVIKSMTMDSLTLRAIITRAELDYGKRIDLHAA